MEVLDAEGVSAPDLPRVLPKPETGKISEVIEKHRTALAEDLDLPRHRVKITLSFD
ncbi:hypothetical protein [Qipengyuania citrea]|uniref:hypothetical protein n=1 Tax=Qipengyuania citrea TaxID=225971 RepID=UPI003299E559